MFTQCRWIRIRRESRKVSGKWSTRERTSATITNGVKRHFKSEETVRIKEIPTRPLLFLFLDKTIARMPTTIPCRDKTDKI